MAKYTSEDLLDNIDVALHYNDLVELPEFDEIEAMTGKAALLHFIDGDYGLKWVPFSMLRCDDSGNIFIKEWLYNQEF